MTDLIYTAFLRVFRSIFVSSHERHAEAEKEIETGSKTVEGDGVNSCILADRAG